MSVACNGISGLLRIVGPIRVRAGLVSDAPFRLGLKLLRAFGRLVLLALATLEIIVWFTWNGDRSGVREVGASKSLDVRALALRLHRSAVRG
jgi:hypothetical protein